MEHEGNKFRTMKWVSDELSATAEIWIATIWMNITGTW